MKKGMKRLVSGLLAVAMVLATFGVNTKTASAEERTMQNYVYDGYEVDFDVTDAWDGAFNADVKIANTGDAEICDWALTFEFAHEIQNIWNATVVEHTGNTYVIKNADWNANIKPGESVAFGMTVLCDGEIAFPENFSFVMEEESVTAQDYSAEFMLYSDWGTGCTGAIVLSNLTDEPIENWQLEFDYDREIVDIANAVIVSHEQGHYVIKNAEYNADIAANSSVHISIVAGEGAAEERPENFTMQQTVVKDNTVDTEGGTVETPEEEKNLVLYVLPNYDSESKSLTITWFINVEDGRYEIMHSADGKEYSILDTVVGNTTYQRAIEEEFGTRYIKVVYVGMNNERIEAVPFVLFAGDNGYSIRQLDSDSDGISDEYEVIFGTDLNAPDTDKDGLSDYDEIYTTKTDPSVFDSVEEGISDAEADVDKDKLSNKEELAYGTDATEADMDKDGLSDYDEIFIYKTKPETDDTDGDTLIDGDEVILGLDPLNPKSFGVPDAEYKVSQKIAADSIAFAEINNTNAPYELFMEITAAGCVEHSIVAELSPYTQNLSDNSALVGEVFSLGYDNSFDNATVNLKIDSDFINTLSDNTSEFTGLEGIKRLYVFRYDEEFSTLYPVETTITSNMLSFTTNELGTYCIIDLNKWLMTLPIEFDNNVTTYSLKTRNVSVFDDTEDLTQSSVEYWDDNIDIPVDLPENYDKIVTESIQNSIDKIQSELAEIEKVQTYSLRGNTSNTTIKKSKVDLVYVIDTSGSMSSAISTAKSSMYELVEFLDNARIDTNVAVVSYSDYRCEGTNGAIIHKNAGSIWATTPEEATALINQVALFGCGHETPLDGIEMAHQLDYRTGATKFIVLITDESFYYSDNRYGIISMNELAEILKADQIYTSVVCYSNHASSYAPLYEVTNGIQINLNSDWPQYLMEYIRTYIKEITEFTAISPTSLTQITLKHFPEYGSDTNSDDDELYDFEEIDWSRIVQSSDGLVLPTLGEYMAELFGANPYASLPVDSKVIDKVNALAILPILSNPNNGDSDGDGLKDHEDANRMQPYDARFLRTFEHVENLSNQWVDDLEVKSESTYNSISLIQKFFRSSHYNYITTLATGNVVGGYLVMGWHNAADFLWHFLVNTGTDYHYDAKAPVLDTNGGWKLFKKNMHTVQALCEDTVVDELYFITNPETAFQGTNFSSTGCANETAIAEDWWFSIGDAYSTMSINCKRQGDTYTAEIIYDLLDYYDWEVGSPLRGGLVTDGQMAELHAAGYAKQYKSIGTYNVTLTWNKGERIDGKEDVK